MPRGIKKQTTQTKRGVADTMEDILQGMSGFAQTPTSRKPHKSRGVSRKSPTSSARRAGGSTRKSRKPPKTTRKAAKRRVAR